MNSLRRTGAFTLVEMLVSMSVLVLLILLVTQLLTSATATIGTSRKRMDADSQARLVFDRMAVDFSRMVNRQDVDYHMRKTAGSDDIAFYSENSGYYSGTEPPSRNDRNPVAIIGYRVLSDRYNGHARCYLERIAKGLGWEPNSGSWQDTAYLPITLVTGTNARWPNLFSTSPADADFQALSDQVFRFEYTYLLSDGTLSSKPIRAAAGVKNELTQSSPPGPAQDESAGYSRGSRWFDTSAQKGYICLDSRKGSAVWGSIGITDVSAIVVALAVLDPTSRVIVDDYAKLAGTLGDAPASAEIAKDWNDRVNSRAAYQGRNFASDAGIPNLAASAVRIYQRYFPFPAVSSR